MLEGLFVSGFVAHHWNASQNEVLYFQSLHSATEPIKRVLRIASGLIQACIYYEALLASLLKLLFTR
jgi:hypothetical protein